MSSKVLVSIIIPVYNVEKYLDVCLKSVLGQTYESIEVVLVDDGSTDSSGEKCDEWSRKDDRIKVIHKDNEGLNYARRDGLAVSTGDWVSFIDSDDIAHQDLVKDLLEAAVATKTDIVTARNKKFTNEEEIVLGRGVPSEGMQVIKDRAELMRYVLVRSPDENVFMVTAWCKLFRRSVIESIDWDLSNSRTNEDELEAIQYYSLQRNGVTVLKKALYYYRDNPTSIMNKPYTNLYQGKNFSRFEWIEELYKISNNYFGRKLYADELLYHNVMLNLLFLNKDIARGTFSDKDYDVFCRYFYPKIKPYKKIRNKYPLFYEEKRAFEYADSGNIFMIWTADRRLIEELRQNNENLNQEIGKLRQNNENLNQEIETIKMSRFYRLGTNYHKITRKKG